MTRVRATLWLVLSLLVAGCSMRSAIDAMSSPQDRALAHQVVEGFRTGNLAGLEPRFEPSLWATSGKMLDRASAAFPPAPVVTDIVGYNVQVNGSGADRVSQKDFTLVTSGPPDSRRWAVTTLRLAGRGGSERIVGWNVEPRTTMPPELTSLQAMDRALPWLRGGAVVGLLVAIGVVVLIVRANRKRRPHSA